MQPPSSTGTNFHVEKHGAITGANDSEMDQEQCWSTSRVPETVSFQKTSTEKRRLTGSTIIVDSLAFSAGPYEGKNKSIHAYHGYPEAAQNQRLPSILMVHGGCNLARPETVCGLVDRGYACLMLDLPGKGNERDGSQSTGPSMDEEAIFSPDPRQNFIFHAVDAVRHAWHLLRQLPQTDRARSAIIGDSWGAVTSSIVASLERDLRALVLMNGCGFILDPRFPGSLGRQTAETKSPDELRDWKALFDPLHYYGKISCPVILAYACDDHTFTRQQFEKSYQLLPEHLRAQTVSTGNHELDVSTRETIYRWLSQELRPFEPTPT